MKTMVFCWMTALAGAAVCAGLEEGFKSPPDAAKPHTWFHMMNGNVTKEGITRDFEELAKVGIGGVQMFDAGCEIPPGGLDFNSPEWFEMFKHAATEAKRLGLEICIPNCSGWSSSGGPWNPPANGMKELTFRKVTASGPARFSATLERETNDHGFYADVGVFAFPTPAAEKVKFDGVKTTVETDGFAFASDRPFEIAGFSFRLSYRHTWSADANISVEISEDGHAFKPLETFRIPLARSGSTDTSLRFHALPRKMTMRALRAKVVSRSVKTTLAEAHPEMRIQLANLRAKTFGMRQEVSCDTMAATADQIVPKSAVRDLTANLRADGTLTWDVPAGEWTILRIGYRCNGRCNHPASDHGRGLEVDKLSAEAMNFHFEQYVSRLCKTLGPLAGNVPAGFNNILVDSYEVGSQNWTQKMEEEFLSRCGYSIRPFMPAFAGYIVDGVETTERFLEDFRRVVADLFAENYANALTKKCHEYGLQCSIEPYGNCPSDNLQYGQYCDIPMGEFWSHASDPYGLGSGNSKFVSYIAHVWGKKFCGTESFTASPGPGSGRWMTTPFAIKAQGDSAFANGVNRIIYHRFTHQPWADDKYLPGMTMGRWGMHLDRTQTWWDFSKPWFRYQARCQHLLQEGTFCADVLFFAGEQAPNQGGNTDGAGSTAFYNLPAGYDKDVCPTDAMYALTVQDGCVVVPGGVKYRLLALPPMEAVSPKMLACVIRLRDAGATVVWPKKPVRAPGLRCGADGDATVRRLADELWAKGVLACTPTEALAKIGLAPDVRVESNGAKDVKRIEWLHRRDATADWYFTAMPNRLETTAELSFRQTGRVPELWDAETGVCAPADVWREEGGRTYVTVPYAICGSKFVVFRTPVASGATRPGFVACEVVANRRPDPVLADPVKHELVIKKALYGVPAVQERPDCADVSRILKPGVPIRADNASMGGDPASMRHKALEVVYTLDGVRKRDCVKEYATYTLPKDAKLLSAWYGVIDPAWKTAEDHFVDVTAKLGGMVKDGRISVRIDNGLAGCDPIYLMVKKLYLTYVYDGVERKLQVGENQMLTIPASAAKAVPPPDCEWRNGVLYAGQPLTAKLTGADGTVRTLTAEPPAAIPVAGAWTVFFPNGFLPNKLARGADEKAVFDRLTSWSENRHEGIRHFSGIATYEKTLDAPALPAGARLSLDLGIVKDFAEVTVNGKTFPVLWKPPFRLDITDAVKPGEPIRLSIRVANLWANRLIGDDRQFEEDCTWRGTVREGVKEIGVKEIPQWVKEGKKSPTGRCTFTTWKHWDKNDELLPSGILGPV
ncbi:MAG: glycosyl hydrolase, partial [Kiritimatiellia bacterium]